MATTTSTRITKCNSSKQAVADVESDSAGSGEMTKPLPGSTGGTGIKVLLGCTLYSSCSVAMVLVNKSLASSHDHFVGGDLKILLVVIQAVVAVVCVEICKLCKLVKYPNFSAKTALQLAPANFLFCGMLLTGMGSLQYNSVPMVTVFKNVTNIIVTAGDYIFFGTTAESLILLAFAVMLGGAVAAAWNDIQMGLTGSLWMAANCLSSAGYVLYLKFATTNVKLSKFGMVFYNNVLCTVSLLPAAYIRGELKLFFDSPFLHTYDYAFKNTFAGFVGFFLNFASLNCVAQAGPTTYTLIGSLNKVPIAILGYVLFDDRITTQTWTFILISMIGGFLFSYAKIRHSFDKKQGVTKERKKCSPKIDIRDSAGPR